VARDRKRNRRNGRTRPRGLPTSLPDGSENGELPENGSVEHDVDAESWPTAAGAFPEVEPFEGEPVTNVAAAAFGDPDLGGRGRSLRPSERVQSDERGPRAGVGAFLRGCWAELQRVQWPDRRQVAQATGVVLGFVVVSALFLGLADEVSQKIVNAIL